MKNGIMALEGVGMGERVDAAPIPLYETDISGLALQEQLKEYHAYFSEVQNTEIEATNYIEEIKEEQLDANNATDSFNCLMTLEAMHSKLVKAKANKGVSIQTAKTVNLAVEHMSNRLGISKKTIFSLENYHTKSARREALNLALENITETITKVIKTILAWLKRAMVFAIDSFEKMVKGSAVKAKEAAKIKQMIVNIKDTTPKQNKIEAPRLAAFVGANIKGEKVIEKYIKYVNFIDTGFSKDLLKDVAKSINAIPNTVAGIAPGKSISDATDLAIKAIKTNNFKDFTTVSGTDASVVHMSKIMPFGNFILNAIFKKNEQQQFTHMEMHLVELEKDQPAKGFLLLTLSTIEIHTLASKVEEAMLNGFYKDHSKIKSEMLSVQRGVESACALIEKKNKDADYTTQTNIKTLLGYAKELAEAAVNAVSILKKYDMIVTDNMLAYCTVSAKQFS
jgi:hypothetical protein